MGGAVVPFDVVAVVGGDKINADLLREPDKVGNDPLLLGDPVILKLNKKAFFAEQVAVILRPFLCAGIVAVQKQLGDLSGKAGGKADQALVVLLQKLVVDPGL